ncbi:MAG: hypothetical protein JSV56_04025 [Methanomassiliicoccales archaeon]|nr:MAG: hypothetical protein JSV56_04025 [Methanomassiliicoccales archaeon]
MKKLVNITIFTILLFNIFPFADTLFASDNRENNEGCVILNLHWSEGEITLNSMKKVVGLIKRTGRKDITQSFFYTLNSKDGETVKTGNFKIPRKLHYDYFDESTGELKGGKLQRDEIDFVIRVPYFRKVKQIMFYKADIGSQSHTMSLKMLLEESDDYELLGAINF